MRASGPFASPAFPLVLVFLGVVALPTSLYLYLAHPAWSWLYLVDPGRVPGIMIVPVLVAHGGALLGAWLAAAALIRADRDRTVLGTLAGAAAALVVVGTLLSGRLEAYGGYEVYHAGAAVGLLEVKLGYVLIATLLGIGAAAGFVAVELLRDSRSARQR